jgi:hypothetical protein
MSELEQKLIRLQAWDDYRAARTAYHAAKLKLAELARALLSAGNQIAARPFAPVPSMPDQVQLLAAQQDLCGAAAELKRTWGQARSFEFPVDAEEVKELEQLGFEM